MNTSRPAAKPAANNDERKDALRSLYLESLQLVAVSYGALRFVRYHSRRKALQ